MSEISDLERLQIIRDELGPILRDWEPESHEPKTTKRGRILRAWRLASFEPVDGTDSAIGIIKTDPGVPSCYILVEP